MIGNCQLALGNKAAAKEAFQKVVVGFPDQRARGKGKGKAGEAALISPRL